ncbi:MAG: hypothetical protein HY804_09505 [Nitrospinae bacterium]|nr:hypothetical protein [Nitrospinota bacterium]
MKLKGTRSGQGMTEYIIIVALIAIAAIAVFTFFGDVVRGQVGGMAAELGGQSGTASITAATTGATSAATAGQKQKGLATFDSQAETGR